MPLLLLSLSSSSSSSSSTLFRASWSQRLAPRCNFQAARALLTVEGGKLGRVQDVAAGGSGPGQLGEPFLWGR